MKQVKENWISDRWQEIDCGIRTGNSKTALNTVKSLTRRQQTKTNVNEIASDKFLTKQSINDGRNTARSSINQSKPVTFDG